MSNQVQSDVYREKALDEYGEKCNVCQSSKNVEIHHKDGDRDNNAVKNLIPLCRSCHKKVHNGGSGDKIEELQSYLPEEMTRPARKKYAKEIINGVAVKTELDEDWHRELRHYAADRDLNKQEALRQAMMEGLRAHYDHLSEVDE